MHPYLVKSEFLFFVTNLVRVFVYLLMVIDKIFIVIYIQFNILVREKIYCNVKK